MYNGIGLKTPRGSGTNGYVSRNLSFVKSNTYISGSNRKPSDSTVAKPVAKKPSRSVLIHNERRQVEIQLLSLRDELEEKCVKVDEVEKIISAKRSQLYAEVEAKLDKDLKVEKEKEMEKVTNAFGISKDYKEGDAFKFPIKPSDSNIERIKY